MTLPSWLTEEQKEAMRKGLAEDRPWMPNAILAKLALSLAEKCEEKDRNVVEAQKVIRDLMANARGTENEWVADILAFPEARLQAALGSAPAPVYKDVNTAATE